MTTEVELRIARQIQQGLFPCEAPDLPGFDLAGVSYPVEAVGGDYFDYVRMLDGSWGILLADISGHDLGASIFMAETRAYVRALAETHVDVRELLVHLNHLLVQDTHGNRFVTMFFVRLDPTTRSIAYYAHGHRGYLLDPEARPSILHSTNMVLGYADDIEIHCGGERQLESGDILVLISDGIEESRSSSGEQFGWARALEVVAAKREWPAAEIVEAVYEAACAFRDRAPQEDDMTVVVLKA